MGRLAVVTLLLVALAATAVGAHRLERVVGAGDPQAELLYLPNGTMLRAMSLGHAPLLADAIYIWAIQYYSDYAREDRYRFVDHVFSGVITELDPYYIDAYWLGALILIVEAGDLEAGLRLLDKGAQRNPDRWVLPYLAAWELAHAGRYEQAGRYFERAAAIPGAPPVVRRMRVGMLTRSGQVRDALALWRELLRDPDADPASRAVAERQIRTLEARVELEALKTAVERFRTENGRPPRNLEELARGGYIPEVPLGGGDLPYVYDPRSGQVRSPEGRILGDS